MNRIWPNGRTPKRDVVPRLDRIERLLAAHRGDGSAPPRPLRHATANHLADALGCLAKCMLVHADRALDAAEAAAAETVPDARARPVTFTLGDLETFARDQRASLPAGDGHPRDNWPP